MSEDKKANEVRLLCGGDVCRCRDPFPVSSNDVIEYVDGLDNYRDAYKTLLQVVAGKEVTDYVERWKKDSNFTESLASLVELDLTQIDVHYVTWRAIAQAWALRDELANVDPFCPTFDQVFRDRMSYLLKTGLLYGLDMGWEPEVEGAQRAYRVSITPTPVPETWNLRLYIGEDDLWKFAEIRYSNTGGERGDYVPVLPLTRFCVRVISENDANRAGNGGRHHEK